MLVAVRDGSLQKIECIDCRVLERGGNLRRRHRKEMKAVKRLNAFYHTALSSEIGICEKAISLNAQSCV